ncbi:hypothetical protein, partial [Clostridium butyricum]
MSNFTCTLSLLCTTALKIRFVQALFNSITSTSFSITSILLLNSIFLFSYQLSFIISITTFLCNATKLLF